MKVRCCVVYSGVQYKGRRLSALQTTVHDTSGPGFRGLMPRRVRASVTAVSITCVAPTVDVPTLHLLLSRGADANVTMVVRHPARVWCCVVS